MFCDSDAVCALLPRVSENASPAAMIAISSATFLLDGSTCPPCPDMPLSPCWSFACAILLRLHELIHPAFIPSARLVWRGDCASISALRLRRPAPRRTPMKFEGFLHLNIRCAKEDLPAIEKFYGDLLGLKTG